MSPTIYISKETKERLKKFIQSDLNRLSPYLGSKKKYPTPNAVIKLLLDVADKFTLSYLEKIKRGITYTGAKTYHLESKVSEEEFDSHIKTIVEDAFKEAE